MSKPEWGTKRLCQTCGIKFYDLLRSPIVCPRCGTEFEVEAARRSRRSRPVAAAKAVPAKAIVKPAPVPEMDEDIEVDEDIEDAEDAEDDESIDDEAEDDPAKDDEDTLIEDVSALDHDDAMSGIVIGAGEDGEEDS